ncbi:MAG: argininosuccinate lyase [Deltaproteobacteria bacterium]
MKLWSGRFKSNTDKAVDDFNSSISFDYRLYKQDITGSIAHAKMLAHSGIIEKRESELIIKALQEILLDIEAGKVAFEVDAEDIHMNIEKILIQRIGDVGKKLHTARSRNDQVALDIRMYLKEEVDNIIKILLDFENVLLNIAKANTHTIMPGYTHLQRAQPITFAHHIMCYFEMFKRDLGRLKDAYKRIDVMPLGAGALAGTTYPIDRFYTAQELGFSEVCQNSIDAVSDRDFVLELNFVLSLIMMHLSRFSEEIILWSSSEFNFIELDDAFSTGSSIMPQKKNPDIAELVRGKTGRVYGNLVALLTIMKALPLAYNKDMQEDKEAVFDTIDTVKMCLPIFSKMLETAKINADNMLNAASRGFLNATDLADYLVKKGMPFRDAHEVSGKLVAFCLENKKEILNLSLAELKSFSAIIEDDIFNIISIENCVNMRKSFGGPAKQLVCESIDKGCDFLKNFIDPKS